MVIDTLTDRSLRGLGFRTRRLARENIFLILVFCLTMVSQATDISANERTNIVVVLVDDMGFSDIGCYGSEIRTPHLDALASEGLRFTKFYNQADERTELHDLADQKPERVSQMVALWESWATENEVAFPERYNMYQFLKKQEQRGAKAK